MGYREYGQRKGPKTNATSVTPLSQRFLDNSPSHPPQPCVTVLSPSLPSLLWHHATATCLLHARLGIASTTAYAQGKPTISLLLLPACRRRDPDIRDTSHHTRSGLWKQAKNKHGEICILHLHLADDGGEAGRRHYEISYLRSERRSMMCPVNGVPGHGGRVTAPSHTTPFRR
ncbi:hypothetical protein LZ30DRAFT_387661 [Colletotrichum cereale]|nr:hypothetical protein LZ30DRAFT_387661 [Colletotrichum cereale]